MEITKDFFKVNGFSTNHPDRVFPTYYKNFRENQYDYRVKVETLYKPLSNDITYNVFCDKRNKDGLIVKKSSVEGIKLDNELLACISLCN